MSNEAVDPDDPVARTFLNNDADSAVAGAMLYLEELVGEVVVHVVGKDPRLFCCHPGGLPHLQYVAPSPEGAVGLALHYTKLAIEAAHTANMHDVMRADLAELVVNDDALYVQDDGSVSKEH